MYYATCRDLGDSEFPWAEELAKSPLVLAMLKKKKNSLATACLYYVYKYCTMKGSRSRFLIYNQLSESKSMHGSVKLSRCIVKIYFVNIY